VPNFVFVVKVSKFCNLRCAYCYEHRELHIREMMQGETLRRLFANVDTFGEHLQQSGITPTFLFAWHGGEPLLLPKDYYARISELQRSLIRRFSYGNSIQTNLYGGAGDTLRFVRDLGWGIGVSIDFTTGIRRNTGGRDSNAAVMGAAEELHQSGARFGVISVLSMHNRHTIKDAYDWVAQFASRWRILPLFEGGPEEESARLRPAEEDVVEVFREIFHRRSRAERYIPVDPLDDYLKIATSRIACPSKGRTTFCAAFDNLYLVNVNGDVYTRPFAYDRRYCLGNINRADMIELVATETYRKCQEAILHRKMRNCPSCEHSGPCDSSLMHEHGSVWAEDGRERCLVPKMTITAIEDELLRAGVDRAVIADWARSWLAGADLQAAV
jgi:uncharacterized protein